MTDGDIEWLINGISGSSICVDKDGDTDMSGGYSGKGRGKQRFTPGYGGGRLNRHKNNAAGWWKVIVHEADKFEQDHFFKMLDNTTNESIDPQNTRVENNKLVFWIKNTRAKDAIRNQSGKLTLKDHTINLFAVTSTGPEVLLSKDEQKAKVCSAMVKRYKERSLSLAKMHTDDDLAGMKSRLYEISSVLGELIKEKCSDLIDEIDFSNNHLKHTGCTRDIVSACKTLHRVKLDNNYIKSITDLKNLERYAPDITHLSLLNNPIKNLMDDSQYISEMRKMFPKLVQLDNVPLPEKIKFDSEEQNQLLPTQKFAILLEPAERSVIENFFLQYVKFHDGDSTSRNQLAPAYDETSIFSIASSWRVRGDVKDKFPVKMPAELIRKNRNFKHCTRAEQRESRLIVGRDNVIKELCEMDNTKHMLQTLNIDTSAMFNNHVTAILSGVIDAPGEYRSFSRTFVLTVNPTNNSFLILNDQLSVIRSCPEIVKKVEKPDFGTAPSTANANQEALVKKIQEATKMVTKYCIQCMEAAGWDYEKAISKFNEMKSNNQIPPAVFVD